MDNVLLHLHLSVHLKILLFCYILHTSHFRNGGNVFASVPRIHFKCSCFLIEFRQQPCFLMSPDICLLIICFFLLHAYKALICDNVKRVVCSKSTENYYMIITCSPSRIHLIV